MSDELDLLIGNGADEDSEADYEDGDPTDTAWLTEDVPVDSIWRENDKRFTRYVKVIAIEGERAVIQGMTKMGDAWMVSGKGRKNRAALKRFGTGYLRVE